MTVSTSLARTTYRGFDLRFEDAKATVVATITSPDSTAPRSVRADTVFAAAERAFNLIDDVLAGPSWISVFDFAMVPARAVSRSLLTNSLFCRASARR